MTLSCNFFTIESFSDNPRKTENALWNPSHKPLLEFQNPPHLYKIQTHRILSSNFDYSAGHVLKTRWNFPKYSGMEVFAHLGPPQVPSASPAMLGGVLSVKSPNHMPHSQSFLLPGKNIQHNMFNITMIIKRTIIDIMWNESKSFTAKRTSGHYIKTLGGLSQVAIPLRGGIHHHYSTGAHRTQSHSHKNITLIKEHVGTPIWECPISESPHQCRLWFRRLLVWKSASICLVPCRPVHIRNI